MAGTTTFTAVPYPYTTTTRTNLLGNPSFETGTAGWSVSGTSNPTLTRPASSPGWAGAWHARAAATVAGSVVAAESVYRAVVAGQTYVVSGYVRGTPGRLVAARALFSPAGSILSGTQVMLTGAWQRVTYAFTVPAAQTGMVVGVQRAASGTSTDTVVDLDGVQLEVGAALGTYFDGDTPAGPGVQYAWTGTPHASTSVATIRTPTAAAVSVTPSLVTEWSEDRAHRTTVHWVIGRADPVVTTASGSGFDYRTGTWQVWCADEAEALRVVAVCGAPVVMVTDPARPAANLYAVVHRVRSDPAGPDKRRWLVVADFTEVLPEGSAW